MSRRRRWTPGHDDEPMPATAKKLLQAAHRILVRKGFPSLSTYAVGAEAGEHASLVFYYFGSKAGLMEALVDSLVRDQDAIVRAEVEVLADERARLLALLADHEQLSGNRDGVRAFYELLPHILRSEGLKSRVAEEFASAIDYDAEILCANGARTHDEAVALAALSIGVVEGLAVLGALEPAGFDRSRVYQTWRNVLLAHLDALGDTSAS